MRSSARLLSAHRHRSAPGAKPSSVGKHCRQRPCARLDRVARAVPGKRLPLCEDAFPDGIDEGQDIASLTLTDEVDRPVVVEGRHRREEPILS